MGACEEGVDREEGRGMIGERLGLGGHSSRKIERVFCTEECVGWVSREQRGEQGRSRGGNGAEGGGRKRCLLIAAERLI